MKKFLGGFCALISLYTLNLKDLRSCLASLRKLSHPCNHATLLPVLVANLNSRCV